MFPKDNWEVGDKVVVNGKHGTIKEFSPDNKKVYVEHRDNENHPYTRWYGKDELPPYTGSKEVQEVAIVQAPEGLKRGVVLHHKTLNYKRIIESIDGLTLTLAMGNGKVQWDSSVWEIVAPDADVIGAMLDNMDAQKGRVDEMLAKIEEQAKQLANQAITIGAIKTDEEFQDKFEQLHEDYEELAKKTEALERERDELKKLNDKQSEMLKEATAKPAPVNPNIVDSLRAENTLLHRENDTLKAQLVKALKSPHEALEIRLARMEEKLDAAADWIEGEVERSMDEAERELEAQMNPQKPDGLLLLMKAIQHTLSESDLPPAA